MKEVFKMMDAMSSWESGRELDGEYEAHGNRYLCEHPGCTEGDNVRTEGLLHECDNCPKLVCEEHTKELDGQRICFACYDAILRAEQEHEDTPDPMVEWLDQRMFEAAHGPGM